MKPSETNFTKREIAHYKSRMLFRIIYILSFNIYTWYWGYTLWKHGSDSTWEQWALWIFAMFGITFYAFDYSKFWSRNVKTMRDLFNPYIN